MRVLEEKLVGSDFEVVDVMLGEEELGGLHLTFLETFSSLITDTTQRFIPVGLRIIRVLEDVKHFIA